MPGSALLRGIVQQLTEPIHEVLRRSLGLAVAEHLLVARSLGRPPRRTILLPNSAHVVTVDHERDQVMSAVGEFVADLDSAAGERR